MLLRTCGSCIWLEYDFINDQTYCGCPDCEYQAEDRKHSDRACADYEERPLMAEWIGGENYAV